MKTLTSNTAVLTFEIYHCDSIRLFAGR